MRSNSQDLACNRLDAVSYDTRICAPMRARASNASGCVLLVNVVVSIRSGLPALV